MNTVYARALVALALVALPASTLASTKSDARANKAKHEVKAAHAKPGHGRASLTKKAPPAKKTKRPEQKAKATKGVARAESGLSRKAR